MTRPSPSQAKKEPSPPLRSYSSVAASNRPTTLPTDAESAPPSSKSQSKSKPSNQEPPKASETPRSTKRKPSRSNIPKPISTSAANSSRSSKLSLAPSTTPSNEDSSKHSPVTPINRAPSQSLDPSLATAFVEPTSDALHAARARRASVSKEAGLRLASKDSNSHVGNQSVSIKDGDQIKRSSGEWRSRIRKQTGMDFTTNLVVNPDAPAAGNDASERGSQIEGGESTNDIPKITVDSQSQRGLKRTISPLVPLATSFAGETRGNRSRSGSFQSIQASIQHSSAVQTSNLSKLLAPSSSRTDFSGSSSKNRLHRVSSELTLDRFMEGNDAEELDSSPPSTPSHLTGIHKVSTQPSSGNNHLVLTSRPRATTIASLGGTALPATESIRRARAGTLFSPIGSLSSQSLHSLAEGVPTSSIKSASQRSTAFQRDFLRADDAAGRSRSGSVGNDSTSSTNSQSQRIGDDYFQDSEDSYVESGLGRSLSHNNRSLSSLRSSACDSPDTSHDDHQILSWKNTGPEVGREFSAANKFNRPRSMTSSLQPKTGVYLPPALRNRTFTASGSFLSTPPALGEDDVFSLQVSDAGGDDSGIKAEAGDRTYLYSAPRRQTISTADKPDRARLSVSVNSGNSGNGSESSQASSGRSSRLGFQDENATGVQGAKSLTRFRSNTTSKDSASSSSSLLRSFHSTQLLKSVRTRSNTSPRFIPADVDRSSDEGAPEVSTPILPTCDLCAAQVSSLVYLLPCRHQACAACCSTGVSQTAACPSRQHLCAACQEPVESIELSIPNQLKSSSDASAPIRPKLASSPAALSRTPSSKSPSFFSSRDPDTRRANHTTGTNYSTVELEGEALKRAQDDVVVVRMDNIPWELCYSDVEQWAPEGTLAKEVSACPVHITIELMTGKTNNTCFIECADRSAAQKLIRSRNNTPLLGRAVTLYTTTRKELLADVLREFLENSSDSLGPCKFGRREMNGIQTLLNSGGSLLKGTVKPLEFFTSIVGLLPEISGGLSAEQGRVLFETTKDIISLLEERVNDPGHLRDSIRRLVETASRSEALTPLQRLALCAQGEAIFREKIISDSYKSDLFATLYSPAENAGSSTPLLNFGQFSSQTQTPELAAQHRSSYFSPVASQSPVSPSTTLSSLGAQTPGGAFGIQNFPSPMGFSYEHGRYDSHFHPHSLMTSPAQAASPRHLENFYPFQPSSPVCLPRSPPQSRADFYRGRVTSAESFPGGNIYASPLSSQPGLGLYQPMGMPQESPPHSNSFSTSSIADSPLPNFYEGSGAQPSLLPAWNQGTSPLPAHFATMGFPLPTHLMNRTENIHPSTQDEFQHRQRGLDFELMNSLQNHQRYLSSHLSSPSRPSSNYHEYMHSSESKQDGGNFNASASGGGETSAQIQADLDQLNAMIASLQQKKSLLGGMQYQA